MLNFNTIFFSSLNIFYLLPIYIPLSDIINDIISVLNYIIAINLNELNKIKNYNYLITFKLLTLDKSHIYNIIIFFFFIN